MCTIKAATLNSVSKIKNVTSGATAQSKMGLSTLNAPSNDFTTGNTARLNGDASAAEMIRPSSEKETRMAPWL